MRTDGILTEREMELRQCKIHFETMKYTEKGHYQMSQLASNSRRLKHSKLIGYGKGVYPWEKSPSWMATRAMGKSLLAITIAACVSTGRPMPDSTPGRQGSIILITSEDSAEDTIKPRMEAVGCDPSRVLLLNTNLYFDEKD